MSAAADPTETSSLAPRIVRRRGPRHDLRVLFEMAEDSPRQLESYIDDGEVLVAYAETGPVGHLQLVASGDHAAEIKNMAVAARYRRHGIGRALVNRAIGICRDQGLTRLLVRAATADIGNLRFYQRLGFRFVAIEPDAFALANGYPAGLEADGIAVRDAVLLAQDLAGPGRSEG